MIHLYYHGGSGNHGCEAIIRSTHKILAQPVTLHSTAPESDETYGIGEIMDICADVYDPPYKRKWERLAAAVHHKLTNTDYLEQTDFRFQANFAKMYVTASPERRVQFEQLAEKMERNKAVIELANLARNVLGRIR